MFKGQCVGFFNLGKVLLSKAYNQNRGAPSISMTLPFPTIHMSNFIMLSLCYV